jgi:hypothetical protein
MLVTQEISTFTAEQTVLETYIASLFQNTSPEQVVPSLGSAIPVWAQAHSFRVLLFRIDNMMLAAPLTVLAGVRNYLNPMRSISHRSENYRIVHARSWLKSMPNQTPPTSQKILLLDGEPYCGLLCDEVLDLYTLRSEECLWRKTEDTVPWVAGTHIQKMFTILHIDKLRDAFTGAVNQ